jgi:ribonuclease HII
MLKRFYKKGVWEAGCDEAGRGCLAGPVVAAAVIWNPEYDLKDLNDSKKLSKTKREELAAEIKECSFGWAIGMASPEEIDKINILNASILAMHRALEALTQAPEHILVDGNRFKPWKEIAHICIIKGDELFQSIAAASILAKTHRDELMLQYSEEYPLYQWERNMGYPTKVHRDALERYGLVKYHRRSFGPVARQLELFDR